MLEPGEYHSIGGAVMGCQNCGATIFAVVWDAEESGGQFVIIQGGQDTEAPGPAGVCRCGVLTWWEAPPDKPLEGHIVQSAPDMIGDAS